MASRARKVFGIFEKRAPEPALHIYEYLFHWQVFIGLAFPYEGPAPLEAIAQGSVFINPKVGLCAVRSPSPGACNFHTASVKRRFHK